MDNKDQVETLLEKGADKNSIGGNGKSCLEVAEEFDYEEVASLLKKEFADPFLKKTFNKI